MICCCWKHKDSKSGDRESGERKGKWEERTRREGKIEKRVSSRATGRRRAANATRSLLCSFFEQYSSSSRLHSPALSAPLPARLPPYSCSSPSWVLQSIFCPLSPSQVPFSLSLTSFPQHCIQHLLFLYFIIIIFFFLHLTPPESEHGGCAPKGWRARELPQGLLLSCDLCGFQGCPVAWRGSSTENEGIVWRATVRNDQLICFMG